MDRRRAMLHHYTEFIAVEDVSHASDNVSSVSEAYESIQAGCVKNPFRSQGVSVDGEKQQGATESQLFPAF